MATFVLIHGAGFGGWSWHLVEQPCVMEATTSWRRTLPADEAVGRTRHVRGHGGRRDRRSYRPGRRRSLVRRLHGSARVRSRVDQVARAGRPDDPLRPGEAPAIGGRTPATAGRYTRPTTRSSRTPTKRSLRAGCRGDEQGAEPSVGDVDARALGPLGMARGADPGPDRPRGSLSSPRRSFAGSAASGSTSSRTRSTPAIA